MRIRRRINGQGAAPPRITLLDLDAFNRLSGMRLAPWEVEVIEMLDDAFLRPAKTEEDDQQ